MKLSVVSLTYSGAVELKDKGARPRQWSVIVKVPPKGKAEAHVPVPDGEVWFATYEVVDCEFNAFHHRCEKDGELVVDVVHSATNCYIQYPLGLFVTQGFHGIATNLTDEEQEFELTLFYERIPRKAHLEKVGKRKE